MFVFDSSTLILIAKIDLLNLFLGNAAMEVAIPKAVEGECCGGIRTFDALLIRKAIEEQRIRVHRLRDAKLAAKLVLDFNMGKGEAETIALAMEQGGQIVGIDDKRGMDACKLLGLPFTNAIALLIRSRQKRLITQDDARSKLAALARYGRYRKSLLEDAARELEALA
jgi:predicted nucleic acid-binding protein